MVCLGNVLTNCTRKPKQRRYSVGLKWISLVAFFSLLVYWYLGPMLNWNKSRTLQHFVMDWPKAPGNLNREQSILRKKTKLQRNVSKNFSWLRHVQSQNYRLTGLWGCKLFSQLIGQPYGHHGKWNRMTELVASYFILLCCWKL